jgi:hypothetical protein
VLVVLAGNHCTKFMCNAHTAVCQTPQMLKAHINALDVEVMNPDEVANEVWPLLTVLFVMPNIHCSSAFHFILEPAQPHERRRSAALSTAADCAQLTALAAVAAVAVAAGRVLRHPRLAPLRVAVWGAGALFLSWRLTSASFQRLVGAPDTLCSASCNA